MKLWSRLAALACLSAICASAQTSYIVLSKSQGKNSTAFASQLNGNVTGKIDSIGVVVVQSSDPNFAANAAAIAGVQSVSSDPEISWINNEPNMLATTAPIEDLAANNEQFGAYQWNLRTIHADQTAAAGLLGKGARVAVLDSGMDLNNPDLKPNIDFTAATSFACSSGVCEPVQPTGLTAEGAFNHGTHVGGIIAAAINGFGVQGVAPQATLVPIKVLRESGSGTFGWLIQGLSYAETQNIDIANMSLGAAFLRNPNAGCTTTVKDCNPGTLMAALNRAFDHATASGILLISAAGNNGVNLNGPWVDIPAQSGNGIAVAATGPTNQQNFDGLAVYTNTGESVVNLAAPGGNYSGSGNVLDAVLSDGLCNTKTCPFYFADGTSMAAPHVAGVAALLVGEYGHIGATRLKALLQNSSVDILTPGADAAGKGRVDAWRATH